MWLPLLSSKSWDFSRTFSDPENSGEIEETADNCPGYEQTAQYQTEQQQCLCCLNLLLGFVRNSCAPEKMDVEQRRQNQKKSATGYRLRSLQQNRVRGAYSAEQKGRGPRDNTAEAEKEERQRRGDTTQPNPGRTVVFFRQSVRVKGIKQCHGE